MSSSPTETKRIPIAAYGPPELCERLQLAGYETQRLTAEAEPVESGLAPPRLALLWSVDSADVRVEQVRKLRARWPLVDVLVVESGASPALVRDLLRAGARDIILDDSHDLLLEALKETLDAQQLLPMIDQLAKRRVRSSRFEGMLSRNHEMWDVFETCVRVAQTDANVLIRGETGTGKELLARAVHRQSRRKGRFVAVNCSALPEHLVESELFGHEKGAFTGAVKASRGLVRNADGGTLFLDEIGDMSPSAQQSLLRVLEERTIRPLGGTEEIPVDVRIVAATHVPLEEAVANDEFREDLFYRLDVIRLEIPPLRERPEDVIYLFGYFAKSLAKHYGLDQPTPGDEFMARLAAYHWPGNVRELENFTERLVLRRKRSALSARDFTRLVRSADGPNVEPRQKNQTLSDPQVEDSARETTKSDLDLSKGLEQAIQPLVESLEREYLEAILAKSGGRMQEAARCANISRRTLQRKLQLHGIDKAQFRGT